MARIWLAIMTIVLAMTVVATAATPQNIGIATSLPQTELSPTGHPSNIRYTYNSVSYSGTNTTLVLNSGYATYLCSTLTGEYITNVSWTFDTNLSNIYGTYASIGHQNSDICAVRQDLVAALNITGIGIDATSYNVTTGQVQSGIGAFSFNYSMVDKNQLTIIFVTSISFENVTYPSGCNAVNTNSGRMHLAICPTNVGRGGSRTVSVAGPGTYPTQWAVYIAT